VTTATTTEKTYAPTSAIGKKLAEVQVLTQQAKALETRIGEIKAELQAHMKRTGLTTVRLEGSSAMGCYCRRTGWQYSEVVQGKIDALEALKKREQANGKATQAVTAEYVQIKLNGKVSPQPFDFAAFSQALAAAQQQPVATR
jgi:hypothetical protein